MPRTKRSRAAPRRDVQPAKRGRPTKGLKAVTLKLAPDQHQALQDAVRRAGLERLPNVAEGASFVVRELVQAWIDRGARWPVKRSGR